jgi:hypothetical protein
MEPMPLKELQHKPKPNDYQRGHWNHALAL